MSVTDRFFKKSAPGNISVAQTQSPSAQIMELAQLYFARCEFGKAAAKYVEVSKIAFDEKDLATYLSCQNRLLRIYAEREELGKIQETKEYLQDLVLKEGFELTAKTYYSLGICATYRLQYDTSLDYFQKSLTIALAEDKKEDICYAIYGLAVCYHHLGRQAEALKEIYNLQVFFQVIDMPELKLASQITNAAILNDLKKHEQALEILWQCYDILRMKMDMILFMSLLYSMAKTYKFMGDLDIARSYLKLAKRSVDPENMRMLSRLIDKLLLELGVTAPDEYDLVLNAASNAVTERKIGSVDFKNQFILLDMLRTFMDQPGKVYSKESLVKLVWKQDYDPGTHDNKIYVTIKRLRKLIEPDYDKPKYIFRAKNGYYLNKSAKILLEQ